MLENGFGGSWLVGRRAFKRCAPHMLNSFVLERSLTVMYPPPPPPPPKKKRKHNRTNDGMLILGILKKAASSPQLNSNSTHVDES